jgi:nucleotide sugar dehydrogenase
MVAKNETGELVMKKIKIGVIGNGFVGGAIVRGFSTYCDVRVYDNNPKKSMHSLLHTLQSDFVFVCLPTPMTDAEGGEANLSILKDFFRDIESFGQQIKHNPVYVIKSTVPVGTTQQIAKENRMRNILHYPEFLTARTADLDYISASRHIIGQLENADEPADRLHELLKERFPGSRILRTDSNESEMIKYASNCFFATKVMFFNEMRLLSDELNMEWDTVLEGVISDGRIGQSHHQVPGHDGDYGFGGTCFPKDINAMIRTMEKYGIDPIVLKSVWEQNKNVRKNWDWCNSSSAVSRIGVNDE